MIKGFTIPASGLSPFYKCIKRIPRKLKKKLNKVLANEIGRKYWESQSNEVKLWFYLYKTNEPYHRFLISEICKQY